MACKSKKAIEKRKAYQKEYAKQKQADMTEAQRKEKNAYMRKWYKNRSKKAREQGNLRAVKYRKMNPDKYRTNYRKKTRALKKKAVAYKGGKCAGCGFDDLSRPEVFDFHHIDPLSKTAGISQLISNLKKWEVVRAELDKCILLCANCHRTLHREQKDA